MQHCGDRAHLLPSLTVALLRGGVIAVLAFGLAAGCSKSSPPASKGQIVVALTIDWEGAYLSPEGLDALDELRGVFGTAPLTHFVSGAYFTKETPDPAAARSISQSVRPGDEIAVHLHAWRSLAKASGIEPKLAPSFLSGTEKLLEFEDGDVGFDVDLDAYSVDELRALLRTSRTLLEQTKLPISRSFRAGGYLGTPKMLHALVEEGYAVDSSATDHRQLDERDDRLPSRIAGLWPKVDTGSQPFHATTPRGKILELPIAAFAEYVTPAEIVAIFEAAQARLRAEPSRDQLVVLGFHQETADEFGGRLEEALRQINTRPELAKQVTYTTIEQAARRVRVKQ